MGYMKIIKAIIYLVILFSLAYISLWYGFSKGYESSWSNKLSDAVIKTAILNDIKSGNIERAINSLELGIDVNLIEYRYSDREFINYIAGLPKPSNDTDLKLLEIIRKHRESSPYKCESGVEVCKKIRATLYEGNETHNKALK